MNRADVMLAIIEMAKTGMAVSAEEALDSVAALAVGLEPARPLYEAEIYALLSVGAHILQRG